MRSPRPALPRRTAERRTCLLLGSAPRGARLGVYLTPRSPPCTGAACGLVACLRARARPCRRRLASPRVCGPVLAACSHGLDDRHRTGSRLRCRTPALSSPAEAARRIDGECRHRAVFFAPWPRAGVDAGALRTILQLADLLPHRRRRPAVPWAAGHRVAGTRYNQKVLLTACSRSPGRDDGHGTSTAAGAVSPCPAATACTFRDDGYTLAAVLTERTVAPAHRRLTQRLARLGSPAAGRDGRLSHQAVRLVR